MPRLPEDIVRQRVINELRACLDESRHDIRLEEGALDRFPIRIWVDLRTAPGPVLRDGKVDVAQDHTMLIEVSRDYPYEKPTVIWATDIFHPNIMVPSDGGFVCTGLLEGWTFRSTLLGFLQGIELLLANPNADNPYGTDSCTHAAAHFNRTPFPAAAQRPPPSTAPRKGPAPRIVRSTADEG